MTGQPLAIVTVKPVAEIDKERHAAAFDPATLGHWELIPDAYRAYWSFDRDCTEIDGSSNESAARELCDKIELYLDMNEIPPQVCRGLDRLRFKAALTTGEAQCVWAAAQAAVTGLCCDDSVDQYQCLLQLGSMSGKIDKQFPEGVEERLRPLVALAIERAGVDVERDLDRLMAAIDRNSWLTYGKLVLDEIRRRSLVCDEIVNPLVAKLAASRLARERRPFDPCEATASVRQYLAQIDADPLPGPIDMNGVRDILEKGLAKRYTQDQSETKRAVVESVVRLLRLIVGQGPFCGDPNQLAESVDRFSYLYLVVDKAGVPVDTVLATFLGLSFCDISTDQDHEALCSQFHGLCAALQSQVSAMLSEHELSSLVTAEDLEGVFGLYERIFRKHVYDPLWPPFKFALTVDERTRLAVSLKLCVAQLEPLFNEMSAKTRYGGVSGDLKETLLRDISRAAQQLLPQTAFLRNPSYPGVSCQYRGQYGFTAVIAGPLYTEGSRPREIQGDEVSSPWLSAGGNRSARTRAGQVGDATVRYIADALNRMRRSRRNRRYVR